MVKTLHQAQCFFTNVPVDIKILYAEARGRENNGRVMGRFLQNAKK